VMAASGNFALDHTVAGCRPYHLSISKRSYKSTTASNSPKGGLWDKLNNAFNRRPAGWKVYQNNTNLEIQNQDGIPVLLLQYKSPYTIIISGLFVTPMGICKVNNETGIYMLGDSLAELGTYRVDRVFVHSIFDLFKSERTYILK
ncbi:MAG: hypothetical protein V1737_02040, partial [Chloroflexota bacterium]